MRYEGIVYRPPSEADSLIIQATIGCPHNICAFCCMYRDKRFRMRPLRDIQEDLDMARDAYGDGVRTLFLADGNSAVLSAARLIAIADAARACFPRLQRITVYGSARFLALKTREEWQAVANAGVTRIHSGLESGDADTLAALHKGVTPDEAVRAYRHVLDAGIELSVYIMIGVAGVAASRVHALGSALTLNRAMPHFVRLRTWVPVPGTPWHTHWRDGHIQLLSPHETLRETRLLIERLDGPAHLLSDHVSNYLDVHGHLPEDKPAMLQAIDAALLRPESTFIRDGHELR